MSIYLHVHKKYSGKMQDKRITLEMPQVIVDQMIVESELMEDEPETVRYPTIDPLEV